jgi:hypothetical protein
MPVPLHWGTVTAIRERESRLVRLEVDGRPCISYPEVTGDVREGDVVLVNTQARELGFGSGGFDVLYANLTRGLRLSAADGSQAVALPFAPGQHGRRFAEQDVSLPEGLEGRPVVCCSAHDQVVPVCAALRGLRVAYVQLGGGALPVCLSDALRALRARGMLEVTIAVSPCLEAELHCVTAASALLTAAARGAEAIVVAIGPGAVGTDSGYGHGGVAAADGANAACALGGTAILAPCVSLTGTPEAPEGLAEHTRAAFRLCLGHVRVAWPTGLGVPAGIAVEAVDVGGWESECSGLPLDHGGRGVEEDPWFFASAFAAGRLARGLAP